MNEFYLYHVSLESTHKGCHTDLESVILSEVSQTEEYRYDIPHMWNLKKRYK